MSDINVVRRVSGDAFETSVEADFGDGIYRSVCRVFSYWDGSSGRLRQDIGISSDSFGTRERFRIFKDAINVLDDEIEYEHPDSTRTWTLEELIEGGFFKP